MKLTTQIPKRIDKPWGYELLIAHQDSYVGKILFVRAGESLSLQYHELKDETIYLHTGNAEVIIGYSEDSLASLSLEAGQSIYLKPGTIHRLEAKEDCTFFEVSTTELDDVVRLEDKYGRVEENKETGQLPKKLDCK